MAPDWTGLDGRRSPPPTYAEASIADIMRQLEFAEVHHTCAKPQPKAVEPSALAAPALAGSSHTAAGPVASRIAMAAPQIFDDEALVGDTRHARRSNKRRNGCALAAVVLVAAVIGTAVAVTQLRKGHTGANAAVAGATVTASAQSSSAVLGSTSSAQPSATAAVGATTTSTATPTSTTTTSVASATPSALWTAGNYNMQYSDNQDGCQLFGISCSLDTQIWGVSNQNGAYSFSNNVNTQGPWVVPATAKQGTLGFNASLNDYTTGDGCIFARSQTWSIDLLGGSGAPSSASMIDTFKGYDITCIQSNGNPILAPNSVCSCNYDVTVTPYT